MVVSHLLFRKGATLDDCLHVLLSPAARVYERDRLDSEPAWNEHRAVRDITSAYNFFKHRRRQLEH